MVDGVLENKETHKTKAIKTKKPTMRTLAKRGLAEAVLRGSALLLAMTKNLS